MRCCVSWCAGRAHLSPEQPGDEEARNDEKHVHADVPATHTRDTSMKDDNGQHRGGAQALDVLAKFSRWRAPTRNPREELTVPACPEATNFAGVRILPTLSA
jgi:hypothetical protein